MAILRLLVVVYALMTPNDYRVLSHVLWEHFLDETDMQIVVPVGLHHLLSRTIDKICSGFISSHRCFGKAGSGNRRIHPQ